jgi:hypothetical protein
MSSLAEKIRGYSDERLLKSIQKAELTLTSETAAMRAIDHMRGRFPNYDPSKLIPDTDKVLVALHAEKKRRSL